MQIRLTKSQTEALDEGASSILTTARAAARRLSDERHRWNITALRARLPRASTRVDIVTAEGRFLGYEEQP
jgi:hypothetical protein